MNNNAMWAVIAVIALVIGGIVVYLFMNDGMMGQPPSAGTPGDGQVVCTLEARQCPDGSYVGRTGPNCEFAKCPGGVDVQVQY